MFLQHPAGCDQTRSKEIQGKRLRGTSKLNSFDREPFVNMLFTSIKIFTHFGSEGGGCLETY